MGEIADMMVYGEMCPCGEYLHDDGAAGYQRFCSPQCEEDFGGGTAAGPETTPRTLKRDKVPCPICGKKVAPVGLRQHQRDKHGPVAAILEERDELRERVEELEGALRRMAVVAETMISAQDGGAQLAPEVLDEARGCIDNDLALLAREEE